MSKSKFFNLYFNEEGEEMMPEGDPNAEMGMEQPEPPPPVMLDVEDTDSPTDKKFPEEKDGTTPEQDLTNFVNYQRLQYFKKFNKLLALVEKTKLSLNNSKLYLNFDTINNEKQHKIINLLISSLEEIADQIKFFLEKGIASVNIDKTRAIFKAMINKMNIILDSFEDLQRQINVGEEDKNKK